MAVAASCDSSAPPLRMLFSARLTTVPELQQSIKPGQQEVEG
jgi:hypothetical protein